MKIEFPPLESEPLVYFLLHSSVFVAALAVLFFVLGLSLGRIIWRSHKKHQAPELVPESVGQQPVRPETRPLESVAVTEVAPLEPALSEVLPAVELITNRLPEKAPEPVVVIADMPAMPEVNDMGQASPPSTIARPKFAAPRAPRKLHAANGEPAIAPFSFLLDDPVEAEANSEK